MTPLVWYMPVLCTYFTIIIVCVEAVLEAVPLRNVLSTERAAERCANEIGTSQYGSAVFLVSCGIVPLVRVPLRINRTFVAAALLLASVLDFATERSEATHTFVE